MAYENLGKVYICGVQKPRKGDYEKDLSTLAVLQLDAILTNARRVSTVRAKVNGSLKNKDAR